MYVYKLTHVQYARVYVYVYAYLFLDLKVCLKKEAFCQFVPKLIVVTNYLTNKLHQLKLHVKSSFLEEK